MRILRIAAVMAAFALPSFGSVSVSFSVKSVGVSVPGKTITARFELKNCTGGPPRVIGTGVIAETVKELTASAGTISGTIYGNDEIDCGGAETSYYTITYLAGGRPVDGQTAYSYTINTGSTFDPSTSSPITSRPAATPPTGDNSYLLLSGGNVSSATVPFRTKFSSPDPIGDVTPSTGVFTSLSAVSVNGVQNADRFASIDAAIAALNATNGGEVYLPAGTYPCPTTTITKPIILRGSGMGGYSNNTYTTLAGPTILTNSSQTADCITIGLNASSALPSVTISDLQIQGNDDVVGATTGSGIKLLGGTSTSTAFRNVTIENVFVYNVKENAFDIRDNSYMVKMSNVVGVASGGHGLYIGRTSGTGVPSQIWLFNPVFDMNAGKGIEIDVGAGDVYIYGGTAANSGSWGLHTNVGSGAAVNWFGPHLETNTTGGIWLQGGGGGHNIFGGICSGNTICIKVDTEASNASQSSAIIRGIYSESDTIVLTSNAKNTCIETSTAATTVTDSGVSTGCRSRGVLSATTMLANNHTFVDSGDTTAGRPWQQRFGNVLLYNHDGVTITHRFNDDGTFEATGGASASTFKTTATAIGNTGTVSMDFALGRQFTTTPAGAMTINATNCATGQTGTLFVTTSGTTAYTLTFSTNFKSAGTLSTGTVTAKTFLVLFQCNGTTAYEQDRTGAL